MNEEEKVVKRDINKKAKSRYWVGVCYPENMVDDWENQIGDLVELPYAYCKHTVDVDSKSEHRKDHVHIILVFPNTTTYNNAYNVFMRLSAPGKTCLPWCEQVVNIRSKYEYLIHNTETAKKQGKHQYKPADRVTGNNFDIGNFEQLSQAEKDAMLKDVCNLIYEQNISNFADLYLYVVNNLGDEYFEVMKTHSGFLERLTRGLYLKLSRQES